MEKIMEIIIEALQDQGYEAEASNIMENVINVIDEDSYTHTITIE